jgi:hypothetical protein
MNIMLLYRVLNAVFFIRLFTKKFSSILVTLIVCGGGVFACEDSSPQATLEGTQDGSLVMVVTTNEVDDRSLPREEVDVYDAKVIIIDRSIHDSFINDFMPDEMNTNDASLSPDIEIIDMFIDEGMNDLAGLDIGIEDSWLNSCEMSISELQSAMIDYPNQQEVARWSMGGALPGGSLITVNLNDRERDALSYFILHGGRVERIEVQGQSIWQSELTGIQKIYGVWDFNTDGVAEVLVGTNTQLFMLSSIQGQVVWNSNALPIPNVNLFSGIGKVMVIDNASNAFPTLYLADSGCSTAGTGYGVTYRFTQGLQQPITTAISTPRLAGRCAQWHTGLTPQLVASQQATHLRFEQLEDTSAPTSILVTDSNGLHEFDAISGQRVACGYVDNMPAAGALPYALSAYQGQSAWFAWSGESLKLLTYQDRTDINTQLHCQEDEEYMITAQWQIELNQAQLRGATRLDFNQDQSTDLLLTVLAYDVNSNQDQWETWLIDGQNGQKIASIPYAMLGSFKLNTNRLGLVMHTNAAPNKNPFQQAGSLQLFALDIEQVSTLWDSMNSNLNVPTLSLWEAPIDNAFVLYQKESRLSDTVEWKNIQVLDGTQGKQILVQQVNPIGDEQVLIAVDALGSQGQLTFEYSIGTFDVACSATNSCELPDRLSLSFDSGNIKTYQMTNSLAPLISNTELLRPTGTIAQAWSIDEASMNNHLITLTQTGTLSVYPIDPVNIEQQPLPLWTQQVKRPSRRAPRMPYPPIISRNEEGQMVVSVRDYRDNEFLTWNGFDLLQGTTLWQHQLPSNDWITLPPTVHWEDEQSSIIYRLERLETEEALITLRTQEASGQRSACLQEWVYSDQEDIFTPFPLCPMRPVRPRVIHALDASNGTCLWRSIIRAYNDCLGPSMQVLSLADTNDEQVELYLTSTNTIRRLDPFTGQLYATQLIPPPAVGSSFAGGWIQPIDGGIVRFGGNGAPDAYRILDSSPPYALSEDSLLWRLPNPEGLRNQSWLFRSGITTSAGLWTTLGVALPLVLVQEGQIIKGVQAQLDTASEQLVEVDSMQLVQSAPEVSILSKQANDQFSVSTLQGKMFMLDANGNVQWHYSYVSAPSRPYFIDWDHDSLMEWGISIDKGQLILYDQSEYLAPTQIWEGECQTTSLCQISEDIDESLDQNRICLAWRPLEGINGAQAQIEMMNGTVIQAWQSIDTSGLAILDQLDLVVGQRYRVAVRAWVQSGERRFYTQVAYSDGVLIIDDAVPSLTLTSDRTTLSLAEASTNPLQLELSMQDDQELAGWSVVVYNESGAVIRSLGSGALQSNQDNRLLTWDGGNRFNMPVTLGSYLILASVTDQGTNQANVQIMITVIP